MDSGLQNSLQIMASTLFDIFGPAGDEDEENASEESLDEDEEDESSDDSPPPLERFIPSDRSTSRVGRERLATPASRGTDTTSSPEIVTTRSETWGQSALRRLGQLVGSNANASGNNHDDSDDPPPLEPFRSRDARPSVNPNQTRPSVSHIPSLPSRPDDEVQDDDFDDEWTDEDDDDLGGAQRPGYSTQYTFEPIPGPVHEPHPHHHHHPHAHHHHHHVHDHSEPVLNRPRGGFPFPLPFPIHVGGGGPSIRNPLELAIVSTYSSPLLQDSELSLGRLVGRVRAHLFVLQSFCYTGCRACDVWYV